MTKVDEYVEDIFGWQGEVASELYRKIMSVEGVTGDFRWGHPVFEADGGPICLFNVVGSGVILAFWRGQQMRDIEPRMTATGTYLMADIRFTSTTDVDKVNVQQLVRRAIELNQQFGDPLAQKIA
jgi:hypothetical protein